METDGLSVQVEREPGGRWVAKVPDQPAASVSADTPSGALRALADKLDSNVRERGLEAFRRNQEDAVRRGLEKMTDEEIEAEIQAARRSDG